MSWFNPSGPKTGDGFSSRRLRIRPTFLFSDGTPTVRPAPKIVNAPRAPKPKGRFVSRNGWTRWVSDE